MNNRQQIANAIRIARAQKGWNQETLAQHIGVTRPQISLWESGKNWPAPVQRERLREVLGVEIPADKYAPQAPTPPSRLTPESAKGVRYAALEMSKVITRLLQEAVEADEAAELKAAAAAEAAELAAAEELRERAIATTRAHAARVAGQQASGTPARRRRQG